MDNHEIEHLIDAVGHWRQDYHPIEDKEQHDFFYNLAKALREFQEFKKSCCWIPVEDRLPVDSYHYFPLNLLLNGRTPVQGGWQDGVFWLDGVEINNVTHWMSLPAAPQQ
ncbi:MAG TPA: DUF551 domain-containing protein [Lelliottia sp.]|jgi:hypothetical protein